MEGRKSRSHDPHRLPPEGGAAECDFSGVHDDLANSGLSGSAGQKEGRQRRGAAFGVSVWEPGITGATIDTASSGACMTRQANAGHRT